MLRGPARGGPPAVPARGACRERLGVPVARGERGEVDVKVGVVAEQSRKPGGQDLELRRHRVETRVLQELDHLATIDCEVGAAVAGRLLEHNLLQSSALRFRVADAQHAFGKPSGCSAA